jgi:undecaprenyl-diphosphatase
MPGLTDLNQQKLVIVFFLTLLLWMIIRGNRNVRLSAILLIITIIFSDQFNSSIIKFWFERPRPCHTLHNVHLLVGCGSGFSFPSSHAVNNFAGALILSFFLPRITWYIFGYAFLIAFSRVYVGVHYPFDVLGGAVIGLICGGMILTVFLEIEKRWLHINKKKK